MFRTAIVYDFDGTLSPGSMQQHSLLPELGFEPPQDFWNLVKGRNRQCDGDEILTYMHCLIDTHPGGITEASLRQHGAKLPFFDGVLTWFDRINEYGLARSLALLWQKWGRRSGEATSAMRTMLRWRA